MNAPTVFPMNPVETERTDETYSVDNSEFLRAVFGDLADARPVIVSFEGNPTDSPSKVWFGRPWHASTDVTASLPASANNYFSLAVFRPTRRANIGGGRRNSRHCMQ